MQFCRVRSILLIAVATFCATGVARAADIVLKNEEAGFSIKGELLAFDGKSYIIKSAHFGRMTVKSGQYKCTDGPCPGKGADGLVKPGELNIHGSNTLGTELVPALVEAYAESIGARTKRIYSHDPQQLQMQITDSLGLGTTAVNIYTRGSKTAAPALENGKAHLGMMAGVSLVTNSVRAVQNKSNGNLTDEANLLALDGLQIIVSPKNPLNALSLRQIARIFSGQIKNWAQLGGSPGPINIHINGEESGLYEVFDQLVLKPHGLQPSVNAERYISPLELSDAVARDPGGIGITSLAFRRNSKPVAISTSCGAARFPNRFDIKNEEYPLTFRHYLQSGDLAKLSFGGKFTGFATSDRAQQIIRTRGFVDLVPEMVSFNVMADRIVTGVAATEKPLNVSMIDQFNRDFQHARRISVTFRFRGDTLELDGKSRQDAKRLAGLMMSDGFRKKEVFLIGFSDTGGSTDRNFQLAMKRVEVAKNEIVSASGGRIKTYRLNVRGYGELLPVSCNDTPHGRSRNRRVEVWVRG